METEGLPRDTLYHDERKHYEHESVEISPLLFTVLTERPHKKKKSSNRGCLGFLRTQAVFSSN